MPEKKTLTQRLNSLCASKRNAVSDTRSRVVTGHPANRGNSFDGIQETQQTQSVSVPRPEVTDAGAQSPPSVGKGMPMTTATESLSATNVEFDVLAARCTRCTKGWVGCRWQDLKSFLPLHTAHPESIVYTVRIVGTNQVCEMEIVP